MNPLSSCCQAPVTLQAHVITASNKQVYICTSCGKPCTVNASAVEELRKKWRKAYIFNNVPYEVDEIKNAICEWWIHEFLSLSDSTLREVLEDIGEDEVDVSDVTPYLVNGIPNTEEIFADMSQGNQLVGRNQERQRVRAIITRRLEK